MRKTLAVVLAAGLGLAAIGVPRTAASAAEPVDEVAVEFVMRNDGVTRAEALRRLDAQPAQLALADRIGRDLGGRAAGTWVDRRTGELVANVLDTDAAAAARAAGARPLLVRFGSADIEAHRARLDRVAQEEGAGRADSWFVDVPANRLVVTVPDGADDPATRRFLDHVRAAGELAEVRPSDGGPIAQASNVYAGRAMMNGAGNTCSTGFAAKDAANIRYMLTAAHCVWLSPHVYFVGPAYFGPRSYYHAGYDEAAVWNSNPLNWQQKPAVWNWSANFAQPVFGVWAAPANTVACKSGNTSGYTCGLIQTFNNTVELKFPDNQQIWVFGLTRTSVCSKPGDSGGPVVVSNWAQGTLSAGVSYKANGQPWDGVGLPYCGSQVGKPNSMLFQPIAGTLARAGLTLVV